MRTLYFNAEFDTGQAVFSQAMVVEDGRIAYIGDLETAQKMDAGERVDLCGGFVTPGFIDSHLHILNYGYTLSLAGLGDSTDSVEAVQEAFGRYMEEKKSSRQTWFVGRGWNQDYFQGEKRFLNRHDLDKVSLDYPVMAIRACGHIAAVNSKALLLAGVTAETPQPEGGCFDVDEKGEPLGIFRENGVELITRVIPAPGKEEIKEYIETACRKLNSFGITSAHSDDFVTFPGVSYGTVIGAYEELEREGKLTVKVYEQSHFTELDTLKKFVDEGYCTGTGSRYFKIGPLKMLEDGSLGARTALLGSPYEDDREQKGIMVYSREKLFSMVEYAHIHGMQVAVHAIGDGAMELVTDAIEQALIRQPRQDHRHGIVHCQITTKDLLNRFGELNLCAYIQSIFLDYDIKIIEARVGKKRAADTYNFKTLWDKNIIVANGSDCPVETPGVMAGIQCAVTRATLNGGRTFLPDQALSVREALLSYTLMGAKASFEEMEKGSLRPGLAADFTVLSENPYECKPEYLGSIRAAAVFLDGRRIFDDKSEAS